MRRLSNLLLAASAVFVLSGCASIADGAYEKISVSSTPESALCKIYREGQGYIKSVATPGETYIKKAAGAVTITCSKAGYKTTSITENPVVDGDNIGNFATLGVGFLIDRVSGAQYRISDDIHVNLAKE